MDAHEESDDETSPASRRRMSVPPWLPRATFESALIVFSLLLALGLETWHQDRQERALARQALEGIELELRTNRDAARASSEFHDALRDTLRALDRVDALPPYSLYYEEGMFRPAGVVATAWESARIAGVFERLPWDLVLALSRLYDRQGEYAALGDRMTEEISTDLRREGAEAVLRDGYRGFIVLSEDFANRERRLVERYDEALDRLAAWRDEGSPMR
ncbi:MAG: hypothetical protein RQ745_07310 [Longimicrobiales bacterium]|nr:hypothetical protein [Longimicrobiales bacterium]